MTLRNVSPRGLAAAGLLILCLPGAGIAQANRAAILDSARVLVDDFRERQSVELIQRALNPALGAPDASWSGGVQLLAQILLRNGQGNEATSWLRWALRLVPSMQVDSVNFPPAVVAAVGAARDFVARSRTDSLARVRWEWTTATASGGFGDLRVEAPPGVAPEGVQVMAEGQGFVDLNRPRRFPPGSYLISGRAPGHPTSELTVEVLPGVTTVVTLGLASAATVVAELDQRRAGAALVRVDARRLGQTSCSVGFAVDGRGLIVTSYRSIRGADALSVRIGSGRLVTGVRVAAYDAAADLAILRVESASADSLGVATAASPGSWVAHFPSCGEAPTISRIALGPADGSLRAEADLPGVDQSSLVLTATGTVAAVTRGSREARPLDRLPALLALARQRAASGSLQTVAEIATRERHSFGQVSLTSATPNARIRVTPLESWQWPETARTDTPPLTFRGPMGRYAVEVLVADQVLSRSEMLVEAARTTQLALGQAARKKKFPVFIPIVGGVALGGLAVLMGGGEKSPPPPGSGSITVQLP